MHTLNLATSTAITVVHGTSIFPQDRCTRLLTDVPFGHSMTGTLPRPFFCEQRRSWLLAVDFSALPGWLSSTSPTSLMTAEPRGLCFLSALAFVPAANTVCFSTLSLHRATSSTPSSQLIFTSSNRPSPPALVNMALSILSYHVVMPRSLHQSLKSTDLFMGLSVTCPETWHRACSEHSW